MNNQNPEFEESAPNDINVVYEHDKPSASSSRVKSGLLITSGFVIFGAMVGGGAFAMTGSIPAVLAPVTAEISQAPADATAPVAGSEANKIADPNFTGDAAGAEPGQIVDPAVGADPSSSSAPDASTAPAPVATDSSPTSSSSSGTQVIVPPKFSGGDDEADHKDGKKGDDEGDDD